MGFSPRFREGVRAAIPIWIAFVLRRLPLVLPRKRMDFNWGRWS